MGRVWAIASMVCSLALGGCGTLFPQLSPAGLPRTPGERASNYGYVPLDPLSVEVTNTPERCAVQGKARVPLLEALPDLSIRFAVADIDSSGGLSFGPSKVTQTSGTYRAVLDYVNVDVIPVNFLINKVVVDAGGTPLLTSPSDPVGPGESISRYNVSYLPTGRDISEAEDAANFEVVTVPVYVGVGLRLSADIRALRGNINISGLGVIGAQAEAGALTGTLTVQTLGVNGRSIAMALPLPNKLDQTTIEAGVLAIGGSRAMLYTAGTEDGQVTATPRIVGLYSPIGSDPRLINAIYSELSLARPRWEWPCRSPGATS